MLPLAKLQNLWFVAWSGRAADSLGRSMAWAVYAGTDWAGLVLRELQKVKGKTCVMLLV